MTSGSSNVAAALGFGTLTPYTRLALTDGTGRTLTAGGRWDAAQTATRLRKQDPSRA